MIWLLDGNVLVALVLDTHVLHSRTRRWFETLSEPFATCAVTEGTLLRVHMKMAVDQSAGAAWEMPGGVWASLRHWIAPWLRSTRMSVF